MKQLLACFLLLLLAVPALAEDNIPLFKDYYYGMPKAEVQKSHKLWTVSMKTLSVICA